jgi:glycosyltransferase involved in cell wall biosynthesis
MTDHLGQSQVLPYLKGLAGKGFEIHLISCEKKEKFSSKKATIDADIENTSIVWHPLYYTSKPPVISTLKDLAAINKKAKQLHKLHQFSAVHCRSYIAALAGLRLKKQFKVPFIFDMRGFWADERIDGAIWNLKNPVFKLIYSYFKRKEREFLLNSDQVISLTHAAKNEIHSWKGFETVPIEVIPCCADLSHFSTLNTSSKYIDEWKTKINIENKFVICYLGSIGTWYLADEMLLFFKQLKTIKSDSIFLFITGDDEKRVKQKAIEAGISVDDIVVTESSREKLPSLLSLCDASIFFIKQAYSKKASSPTKMGELMSMNLPIITNSGVGDVADIMKLSGGGVVVNSFDESTLKKAAIQLLEECNKQQTHYKKEIIDAFYDLKTGVELYAKCYFKLIRGDKDAL